MTNPNKMENNYENLELLKIEIDSRTILGIFEETLFYEKEDFNGDLNELQIPLENIKQIEFKDKRVNTEKTKGNLIGDFLWTVLDSGAHPTTVEYKNPEIIIEYSLNEQKGKKFLKIENRKINKEIFEKIKIGIENGKKNN